MIFKKLIFLILIIGLLSCNINSTKRAKIEDVVAEQKQSEYCGFGFPKLEGYVNDYENIFLEAERKELNNIIKEFENNTTNEIFIVTINAIAPYTNMHKFATDLANNWRVGKIKKDNGLVIVVSKKIRKIAISTGKETEKTLTDEICKDILETTIIPKFKEKQYFRGLKEGLIEIITKWKNK